MNFRPHLDGLRFFAFLAVFLFHANNNGEGPFAFGSDGVLLFFALSGFLITRILMQSESGAIGHDLRIFYIRRTLRIFPLYYAALILLMIADKLPDSTWHLFYAYNIRMFTAQVSAGPSHFWSLCVEEQFYLSYPLIFYFLPKGRRLTALVLMLLGSIALRTTLTQVYPGRQHIGALMPVAAEYLLMGAIAGYAELKGLWKLSGRKTFWLGIVCYLIALGTTGYARYLMTLGLPRLDRDLKAASFALMVYGLWTIVDGPEQRFFGWKPFSWLGKISYGLYVFHAFAIAAASRLEGRLPHAVLVVTAFVLTVLVSSASWYIYEERINGLKRLFPYRLKEGATRPHAVRA